jgi:adenylate cyclase
MAFWGWPADPGDQILKAAQTALRIRERFDTQGQYRDFSCGLGLAHGPAVAGKLGAHDLAKVDVFGPTVNLASRLESLTKRFGVRILMDESVAAGMRAAGMDRQVGRIRQLGRFRPVGMENVREGVMISELMAKEGEIGGEMWEAVRRRWEEAVKFFLAGDWPRALKRFRDQFGDDKAGQELIKYIEASGPLPPGEWEVYPVVPLESK